MERLSINKSKKELKESIDSFIWEFKLGDNIKYNIDILFGLVENSVDRNNIYNKPISIIAISIIEAIMIDFLYRLYHGTNHFPSKLNNRCDEIKDILRDKNCSKINNLLKDDMYIAYELKNFNFSPMISLYKRLELLGSGDYIYDNLDKLSKFRNRVHIKNYYDNFEKDERVTFSSNRVQKTINYMLWIIDFFENEYRREW